MWYITLFLSGVSFRSRKPDKLPDNIKEGLTSTPRITPPRILYCRCKSCWTSWSDWQLTTICWHQTIYLSADTGEAWRAQLHIHGNCDTGPVTLQLFHQSILQPLIQSISLLSFYHRPPRNSPEWVEALMMARGEEILVMPWTLDITDTRKAY